MKNTNQSIMEPFIFLPIFFLDEKIIMFGKVGDQGPRGQRPHTVIVSVTVLFKPLEIPQNIILHLYKTILILIGKI